MEELFKLLIDITRLSVYEAMFSDIPKRLYTQLPNLVIFCREKQSADPDPIMLRAYQNLQEYETEWDNVAIENLEHKSPEYRHSVSTLRNAVKEFCKIIETYYPELPNNADATTTSSSKQTITVEAETPETSTPDFLHMESFSPKIPFEISLWYDVLKNEGVIIDVDEGLFCDCISHAHMNELFKNGKTAKLKCVVHHLKTRYEPRWFDVVCSYLGVTKMQMGKFNLGNKRKEFEQKLPF